MTQQNIQAAMFEFTTVDEVVSKYNAKELLPECTYTTPAIPMFGEPCANPLVTESHTLTHPAIYTAEISNYKMIGGCAFPIIDDKCVKPQLFNANEWETWEQARGNALIKDNIIAYRGLLGQVYLDDQAINLCGNGSFNYVHWMTEFLPQLILLKNSGVSLADYKILVFEKAFPSMLEALKILGIKDSQIIPIKNFHFYIIKKVIWVTPIANIVFQRPNALDGKESNQSLATPAQATYHKYVLQVTRDTYLSGIDLTDQDKQPTKIFIKRTPGGKENTRVIANELEIQLFLEANGFVSIDPSQLTFQQQVQFFSNAKQIVAPSGAALANMLWAPKGAHVVVMMNDSKVVNYWYFTNIAAALGHKMSYVLGKIDESNSWVDINHADFSISIASLTQAVNNYEKLKIESIDINKIIGIKFAFIVHEPVLLSHYRDIWRKLNKKDFAIILTDSFAKEKGVAKNSVDSFLEYLKENEYKSFKVSEVFANKLVFPYVISNHCIQNYKNSYLPIFVGKKQIRFMYGADVGDGWSLQPWNEMYDYFLCHGVNDQKAIESRFKGKTFIMGYPRYDSFFDPALNTQNIKDEFNLDPAKKTILWMPTLGGDYSSIPRYAEQLKHLIPQYNFIIRPHPISFVQEPEFIALLERCGYLVDRNAIRDMNALYKASDLVLADNGGSPFSAIFMGKNVVFLEVPEDLGKNQNSFHIVNTSVYELKKHLPVIKENDTQRLEQLLNSDDFYKENSKIIEEMFKKFFDCPRGGGAQRVADILNSLE